MPITFKCARCGKVIAVLKRPEETKEIAKKIKRCPHCGKKLSQWPLGIEVEIEEEP